MIVYVARATGFVWSTATKWLWLALLFASNVKTIITTVVKFGSIGNKKNSKACSFIGPFAFTTSKPLDL